MRMAAVHAGIPEESLQFALEPEAASVAIRLYMKNLKQHLHIKPGVTYITVDCGGGTVDCCMHKVLPEGSVVEMTTVSGGPWGSTMLDREFVRLIETALGTDLVSRTERDHPREWVTMLQSWETLKRDFGGERKLSRIFYSKTIQVGGLFESIPDWKKKFKPNEVDFSPKGDLILKPATLTRIFDSAVKEITKHVHSLLENEHIDFVFLVGGFGTSIYLQDQLSQVIADFNAAHPDYTVTLQVPTTGNIRPGNAVLLGAGLTGCHRGLSVTRRARHTYGFTVAKPYNAANEDHVGRPQHDICGKPYVYIFDVQLRYNEMVTKKASTKLRPVPGQTHGQMQLLASPSKSPVYVEHRRHKTGDEPQVEVLATVDFPIPPGNSGDVVFEMEFGREEINAKAYFEKAPDKWWPVKADFLYGTCVDFQAQP
eukprot:TRINITY_DN7280_c0_g1_i1.p1 TRINITY_DN7280_c0_g1~~TRINITY_DN7280_c0_g1_i1.p1  ORF type:complete len:474 (-),score=124.39 TRINITY_DN7280_c0_g1_i1:106-1383(-)